MTSHRCQHLLLAYNTFQLLQLSLQISPGQPGITLDFSLTDDERCTLFFSFFKSSVALQPDNCGPTYIIIGDGGNEEGVEDDFTVPQAAWSAYRDLAFGQASFVILNETTASWIWSADDGTPIDAVSGLCLSVMCVR